MKTVQLIVLVVLIYSSSCFKTASSENKDETLFNIFKDNFKKGYKDIQESQHRFEIFVKNLSNMFTQQEEDKHASYQITEYADLTPEEFEEQYLTLPAYKINEEEIPQQEEDAAFGVWEYFFGEEQIDMPTHFDWREKGVLTETKAQSTCGSCWAFTSTAMIETQYAIKHGKSINLAEQQLLDCDTINDGCKGGLMTDAFKFMSRNDIGLQSKDDYGEYLNSVGQCHYDPSKFNVKVVNYYQINKDEYAIQKEVYENGPVGVGINGRYLQFYDGGILDNKGCDNSINHAVVIVGFGEENGVKYWIVRNTWGPQWGDDGYFRLIRGEKKCGVHTYATRVFVE